MQNSPLVESSQNISQTAESSPSLQSQQPTTSVKYAGFIVRFAALTLDGLILGIPTLIIVSLVSFVVPLGKFVPSLLESIIFISASVFFLTRLGATPGKTFFGIAVIGKDGQKPSVQAAILRESLGRILSSILNLGYLWVIFNKEKQGWHDKIASTHVIVVKPLGGLKKFLMFIFFLIFPFAILGILAAVVLVAINPAKRLHQANDAKIKSDIGFASTSIESFYRAQGSYPSSLNELVGKGFLKGQVLDPSGVPYYYSVSPSGCLGTSLSPCTQASLYGILFDPTYAGSVWCWQSKTGTAKQVKVFECEPT